jgi:hypothetical protein
VVGQSTVESLLLQFDHPSLRALRLEIARFASLSLPPMPTEIVSPSLGLLAVVDRVPRGCVVVAALPSYPPQLYLRHVVAAMCMGNPVVLAPIDPLQCLIADRARRAAPSMVRCAGFEGSPRPREPGDIFVMLTTQGGPWSEREELCRAYSVRRSRPVRVRTSFCAPRLAQASR